MKEIKNGVWPVMITPFTEDNKIDYVAVQGIIDWYAAHGVTGIFAVCQSSEMFFLSKEERLELAKYVIEHGHEKGMGTCCDLDQLKAKCEAVKGTPLKIFNANAATLLESMRYGVAGYSGVMANFHADLYAWLVEHFNDADKQDKVEQMMAFLGATSMVECQIYPVNCKYHMNLVGVPMSLVTRTRDPQELVMGKKVNEGLPSSKLMEIQQFKVCEDMFRKAFFG